MAKPGVAREKCPCAHKRRKTFVPASWPCGAGSRDQELHFQRLPQVGWSKFAQTSIPGAPVRDRNRTGRDVSPLRPFRAMTTSRPDTHLDFPAAIDTSYRLLSAAS